MRKTDGNTTIAKSDAFTGIAVWQFMAFILLLCFVWLNEVFDLANRVFDASPSPFNLYRAFLLSAGVIVAGIVAVGHTFECQRAVIRRLLMTCLYCHRVKTDTGQWVHVEDYFLAHFPVEMDRGTCDDCKGMLESIERKSDQSLAEAIK